MSIDILCVGTGRDGTVTMTHLINQIFAFEGKGRTCGHEILSRWIYNRLHQLGYEALCSDGETLEMIQNCKYPAIAGAGYSVAQDVFLKANPRCKLIHLKRKNKQAFIESYSKMMSQFPHLVGGYSDIDESQVVSHIMTACDFNEISKKEWSGLPASEKISWYYDKTHQLIDAHKHLFSDYKIFYTEDLNDEKSRRELAEYVLDKRPADFIPDAAHLNMNFFQNYQCNPHEKSLLHWWFHDLNPHDILKDDSYLLDFIANKYTALMGYHQHTKLEEFFGLPSKSADKIEQNMKKSIEYLRQHADLLLAVRNEMMTKEVENEQPAKKNAPFVQNSGIQIINATYGWNCRNIASISLGNVSAVLAKKCNGKDTITFEIDVNELGDPASGRAKDLSMTWGYAEDPEKTPHHLYIPAEANGKTVEIPPFRKEAKEKREGAREKEPAEDSSALSGANKFIFLAALPKSASSLVWLLVSALQEKSGRANPNRVFGTLPSPYSSLNWDLLDRFSGGGTYKSHTPMSHETDVFLRYLGCKYLILLRHPADFIVALYCHFRGKIFRLKQHNINNQLDDELYPEVRDKLMSFYGNDFNATKLNQSTSGPWVYSLSPIPWSILSLDNPIEETLAYFITKGPLLKALEWMSDWLLARDEARSMVVTYEDLMENFDSTINHLACFIRGETPSIDIMEYFKSVLESVRKKGHAKSNVVYPYGWTGSVNIWKRYFSAENLLQYNKTVERFLNDYPHADKLLSVYPSLIL